MMEDLECIRCDSEISLHQVHLLSTDHPEYVLKGDYSCIECELEQSVFVKDRERSLLMCRVKSGRDPDSAELTRWTAKDTLERESHPDKKHVESLLELKSALDIMGANWSRLEKIIKKQPSSVDERWKDLALYTDFHNYLASSYTFTEIWRRVQSQFDLPENIYGYSRNFEQINRVILGLRIYTQHEKVAPIRLSFPVDGQGLPKLLVDLDEIWIMESQVTEENPDGYEKGAEHHYSMISGEEINVGEKVKEHYLIARRLVQNVKKYVETNYTNVYRKYGFGLSQN
jgi:hypothetical protein